MVKSEKVAENSSEIVPENTELLHEKAVLSAVLKAVEKKVPIILWEKKDEGKDFIFEILSKEGNIITANLIDSKSGKKSEIQFQIKPKALNTQLTKLIPNCEKGKIIRIKYLGEKDQDSGFTYKAFVVWLFNEELMQFVTKV